MLEYRESKIQFLALMVVILGAVNASLATQPTKVRMSYLLREVQKELKIR